MEKPFLYFLRLLPFRQNASCSRRNPLELSDDLPKQVALGAALPEI